MSSARSPARSAGQPWELVSGEAVSTEGVNQRGTNENNSTGGRHRRDSVRCASARGFYIVREGASGPCRVVDTRPTHKRTIVVGKSTKSVRKDESAIVRVSAAEPAVSRLLTLSKGLILSEGGRSPMAQQINWQVYEKGSWRSTVG